MPGGEQDKALTTVMFFENSQIRREWHQGQWYYSVVDVVAALTASTNPRRYWSDLKRKVANEGYNQLYEDCVQLKFRSLDKKSYRSDGADKTTILRIIQSIPSPKAEPFKMWLAQLGSQALTFAGIQAELLSRYEPAWVDAFMRHALVHDQLTDNWQVHGIPFTHISELLDVISQGTFGLTMEEHAQFKRLPPETNLALHYTPIEHALATLAKATTYTLNKDRESQNMDELQRDAEEGGKAAGEAGQVIEKTIGKPVVSRENYLTLSGSEKPSLPLPSQEEQEKMP